MADARPSRPSTALPWAWLLHGALLVVTSFEGCAHLPEGSGYHGLYLLMAFGALVVGLFSVGMALGFGRGGTSDVTLRVLAASGVAAASLLALVLFPMTGEYLRELRANGMTASAVIYLASPLLSLATFAFVRRPVGKLPVRPSLGLVAVVLVGGHFALRDAVPGQREVRHLDEERQALGERIARAVEKEDPVALAQPEMWQYVARRPFASRYDGRGEEGNALRLAIDLHRAGSVRVLLAHRPPDTDDELDLAVDEGDASVLAVYVESGVRLDRRAVLRRALLSLKGPGAALFLVDHGVPAERLLCLATVVDSQGREIKERLRYVPDVLAHGARRDARCPNIRSFSDDTDEGTDGGDGGTIAARLDAATRAAALPDRLWTAP